MTNEIEITFTINGKPTQAKVEPRKLLSSMIREDLALTGTHVGCDTTNCGACTVIVDGKAIKSCTMLAVQAGGKDIQTIEGLLKDGDMHPLQKAFLEKNGLQCGFCTPGMVMSCHYLLSHNKNPTDGEIRKAISGNICRCTGYEGIVMAVKETVEKEKA